MLNNVNKISYTNISERNPLLVYVLLSLITVAIVIIVVVELIIIINL